MPELRITIRRERRFIMRKVIVIASVLLMTLVFGPAAFAQSGSVSYGTHGHSWYADGSFSSDPHWNAIVPESVIVKGIFHDNSGDTGSWYYYVDSHGEKQYYKNPVVVKGVFDYNGGNVLLPDFDRDGQWEFYKDSRGVLHSFYVDPDREGQYQRYTDQNGVTQYVYQYTGWKMN